MQLGGSTGEGGEMFHIQEGGEMFHIQNYLGLAPALVKIWNVTRKQQADAKKANNDHLAAMTKVREGGELLERTVK